MTAVLNKTPLPMGEKYDSNDPEAVKKMQMIDGITTRARLKMFGPDGDEWIKLIDVALNAPDPGVALRTLKRDFMAA